MQSSPITRLSITLRRHWLLLLMVAIWAIVLASFAIARNERLNATVYDLGIKSQVIWNTYQGRWFASSIEVSHYFGDHVQVIFLLLAPLFALWPDVNVLLVVQAVLLALGAIPVYRLARRKLALPNHRLALLFAAVYLLYPTVGFVNRFDFHALTFVIFFLLTAVDLLESKRPFWASLFVLLALLTREDVGLTVFMLGLYVTAVTPHRRLGLLWAGAGLTWSLTTIFVVIPAFRGEASDTLSRYSWLGDSPLDMLRNLFLQPRLLWNHLTEPFRLAFLAKMFLPVGFLAFLSPLPLLIGLPLLGYNLLSTEPSQSSIYFQYISPFIPFIFLAAIQGAAWLQRRWPARPYRANAVLVTVLTAGVGLAWLLDNPFTQLVNEPYYPVYALEQLSDADAFHEATALMPSAAPVATMMNYGPHLSLRPEYYLFYDRIKLKERPFGFQQTDYLLLHLTDLRWGVNTRIFYRNIETAVGQFGYEAIFLKNDVVLLTQTENARSETGALLQRVRQLLAAGGAFAPTAPATLAWLGQQWVTTTLPETAVSAPAQFENEAQLLAFQLNEDRHHPGTGLCTTLYWQTAVPITQNDTIFLHLVAADGFVQAQRDGQPAQGFHPMNAWQPGEIVGDQRCFRLPQGLAPGDYTLQAGIYRADSGARLAATSTTQPVADSAVTLATITISPRPDSP